MKKTRNYIAEERKKLLNALDAVKYLKTHPSAANFVLCEIISPGIDSRKLCDHCGKRGLILRDCSDFRGLNNRFVRIAVRKENENKKLVNALKEIPWLR